MDEEQAVCTLIYNIKHLGKSASSIEPQSLELDSSPSNVRELITEIVKICVRDYVARAHTDEVHALTQTMMDDMAAGGMIGFGMNNGEKMPDPGNAIQNALQAFKDGIFCIFLGEDRLESLEDSVSLSSTFTFIRLTMLCGRMW